MARTAPAQQLISEIVSTLLSPGSESDMTSEPSFAEVASAATNVEPERVDPWIEELCGVLAEDPENVRELQCLVALGLAHAEPLARHRVQVLREGRRLAVLLELEGRAGRAVEVLEVLRAHAPNDQEVETDLAEMMRKAGRGDELIESYLRQADVAVRAGNTNEAVRWLQEVLSLDRTRRDVQRMIRDLRFQDTYSSQRWARRGEAAKQIVSFGFKLSLVLVVLAGVAWRDLQVRERFDALPAADLAELASVRGRLAAVDDFIASHRVWTGVFGASQERGNLRNHVHRLEGVLAAEARQTEEAELLRRAMIDSALERGRQAITTSNYDLAMAEFESALELAGPEWEQAETVRADVEAIRAFTEERR